MKPKFSVVIPLYNKADTIERAIRSVWAQTYDSYEIIVVNDGSTDHSVEVVKRLSAERSIRLINQKNAGVSFARNRGATEAVGEFVALLDADDYWLERHLQDLRLINERNPHLNFIGTGYSRVSGGCVYSTIAWPCIRQMDVFSAYCYAQRIHTSSVAIRTSTWLKIGGFNPGLGFYEDYEFFFRLGLLTRVGILPRASAVYMDDSSERITTGAIMYNAETRPHLLMIDRLLKQQETLPVGLVKYATVQSMLSLALSNSRGSNLERDAFVRYFPELSKQAWTSSIFVAKLWLYYYKVRNHLVVWKTLGRVAM